MISANPISLATTLGISVDFFSSGYLDVSVLRVRFSSLMTRWHAFNVPGCPIRISADHFMCADPRSFSQLTTSFIASVSLGIRHTPLTISCHNALALGYLYLPLFLNFKYKSYYKSIFLYCLLMYHYIRLVIVSCISTFNMSMNFFFLDFQT